MPPWVRPVAVTLALLALCMGCVVFLQRCQEDDCKARGGHVQSNWGGRATVYLCLTPDGRVIDSWTL